jgi:hypothetical protein
MAARFVALVHRMPPTSSVARRPSHEKYPFVAVPCWYRVLRYQKQKRAGAKRNLT